MRIPEQRVIRRKDRNACAVGNYGASTPNSEDFSQPTNGILRGGDSGQIHQPDACAVARLQKTSASTQKSFPLRLAVVCIVYSLVSYYRSCFHSTKNSSNPLLFPYFCTGLLQCFLTSIATRHISRAYSPVECDERQGGNDAIILARPFHTSIRYSVFLR